MKIITGMHRSASSLVARLFFENGADFGNVETMYPADKWNPDGYFEQIDFHNINIPLIHGPYGKLSYFFLPSKKTILKRSERFSEDIRLVSDLYHNKFVKEVRFSLALPAWIAHGSPVDRILICLREPYQVAKSLKRRNHAFLRHGLHLWYVHYRELLNNINDIPYHIIFYENLMNSEKYLKEVCNALRFMEIDADKASVNKLCTRIISHKKSNCTETNFIYPSKIQKLWDELRERHEMQDKHIPRQ